MTIEEKSFREAIAYELRRLRACLDCSAASLDAKCRQEVYKTIARFVSERLTLPRPLATAAVLRLCAEPDSDLHDKALSKLHGDQAALSAAEVLIAARTASISVCYSACDLDVANPLIRAISDGAWNITIEIVHLGDDRQWRSTVLHHRWPDSRVPSTVRAARISRNVSSLTFNLYPGEA